MKTERTSLSARKVWLSEALRIALIIGAIWLSWEVVKALLVTRAPAPIAVRVAPASPEAVQRLAEAALVNGDLNDALELSESVLAAAPFSVKALRVRGLAEARLGERAKADEILTLAGNWSLRDDPAHAWLVDNRLRNGDYGSAFAHADTLVRRREDVQPQIFNLFSTAALSDQRALGPLIRQLGNSPPWRLAYLDSLYAREDGASLLLNVAIGLEQTKSPLTRNELEKLYLTWAAQRRYPAMRLLRQRLERPAFSPAIVNGSFSEHPQTQLLPFTWRYGAGPGLAVEIAKDDLRLDNLALRTDYDGLGSAVLAEQVLMLAPGEYRFRGEERVEAGPSVIPVSWMLTCVDNGATLLRHTPTRSDDTASWKRFEVATTVPNDDCSVQILHLTPKAGDLPVSTILWFDALQLVSHTN